MPAGEGQDLMRKAEIRVPQQVEAYFRIRMQVAFVIEIFACPHKVGTQQE